MNIKREISISSDFKKLFNKHIYEKHILNMMNQSTKIFPGKYKAIEDQSHGECDFVDVKSELKYDAKLAFKEDQIRLLVQGEVISKQIQLWLEELRNEASDFNPLEIRKNPNYNIADTKLYKIFEEHIKKDSPDENIIFFIPFPIVNSFKGSYFLLATTDYLKAIYEKLNDMKIIGNRTIYVIYPSSESNEFVLRNLNSSEIEFISYVELETYFTYKVLDCHP